MFTIMKNRKVKLVLFYVFLFSFLTIGCSNDNGSKDSKPNIIFLLTDDQRWDAMRCMGNPNIDTPEMDKLAADGIKFTNAYVTTPICAVSRASILSGQYARRHSIADFKTHFTDSLYQFTYPMQLKKNGYYVGFIGKYGIGKEKDFPDTKYDYWNCFPGQGKYWHKDSLGNPLHLTKILGEKAIEFLRKAPENKPFCLSVSFKAPHAQDGDPRQFLFDSTYADLYRNKVFPLPETSDSSFWYSFPEFFRKNNEARKRWQIRFSNNEKYQRSMKGYYSLIYGVDVQIGKIRKMLKKTGRDKNTIIMLMGDNGFYLAEHGMAGKWYIHEESIRVPFIIYDPRVLPKQKGLLSDKIVLNIDVAPTILDYAGVETPETIQGKSLRAILYNQENQWRSDFLFEHPFKHKTIPRSEGIVSKDWKYSRFIDRKLGYEWMYDLKADPQEKYNLAEEKKYSSQKKQLIMRFEELVNLYK